MVSAKGSHFTRHTRPKGYKCDGIDAVFKVDEASKMSSNVSDDSSTESDESNWNDKSRVSIIYGCK